MERTERRDQALPDTCICGTYGEQTPVTAAREGLASTIGSNTSFLCLSETVPARMEWVFVGPRGT
jgi:hypothetical protein